MPNKAIEFPCLDLPMGKKKATVKATIYTYERPYVSINFDRYVVRGKEYSGCVNVSIGQDGQFEAKHYDHYRAIHPSDKPFEREKVTHKTREAICEDALAAFHELRAAKPEVFLDAEIAKATSALESEERERDKIEEQHKQADEKVAECVRRVKEAIAKRKAFKKK